MKLYSQQERELAANACSVKASAWASNESSTAMDDEMESLFGVVAWDLAGRALSAADDSLEIEGEYWLMSQWAQAEALIRTGWEPS
jgi:hypothetical protein